MDADDPLDDSASDNSSDDSDDDDDTALLMAELHKIKQEKAMEEMEKVSRVVFFCSPNIHVCIAKCGSK